MLSRFCYYIFLISFLLNTGMIYGQELNCRVQISTPGMHDHDRQIMQTLRSELYDFINHRTWTNYQFNANERIESTILITIEEKQGHDLYKGTIQVQLSRPVFNTSYNSPVLNINDRDLQFRYRENEPLEYSDNTFLCNLTSVIAYYVYIIIGFDFDTFSPLGGTPYFAKAQNIVNLAQGEPETGWKSYESQQNRYWLIENIFNANYRPIREALYKYHREGFDNMVDNMDLARKNVTEALELLRRAHRQRPGSYLMQIVMTTKNDELVNLYTEAPSMEQNTAVSILTEIDPSNASKYRKITQPQ